MLPFIGPLPVNSQILAITILLLNQSKSWESSSPLNRGKPYFPPRAAGVHDKNLRRISFAWFMQKKYLAAKLPTASVAVRPLGSIDTQLSLRCLRCLL